MSCLLYLGLEVEGKSAGMVLLSFPPPFLLPCPSTPSFLVSLPLEVGPFESSYWVWGSAVSFPSGVWGIAPAKIELVHFSFEI